MKAGRRGLGGLGWDLSVFSTPTSDLPPCPHPASECNPQPHNRQGASLWPISVFCVTAGPQGALTAAAEHLWARNPTFKSKFAYILLLLVQIVSRFALWSSDSAALCVGEPG